MQLLMLNSRYLFFGAAEPLRCECWPMTARGFGWHKRDCPKDVLCGGPVAPNQLARSKPIRHNCCWQPETRYSGCSALAKSQSRTDLTPREVVASARSFCHTVFSSMKRVRPRVDVNLPEVDQVLEQARQA